MIVERADHTDELVVTIEDDGTGAAADAEGAGIRGMRERAGLLGGSLSVDVGSRHGTVVTARLPWEGPS